MPRGMIVDKCVLSVGHNRVGSLYRYCCVFVISPGKLHWSIDALHAYLLSVVLEGYV